MDITVYNGLLKTYPFLEYLVILFVIVLMITVTILLGWILYNLVISDIIDNINRVLTERKYKMYLNSLRPTINKFKTDETLNDNFKSGKYRKYMLRGYLLENGVNESDLDVITEDLWKYFNN